MANTQIEIYTCYWTSNIRKTIIDDNNNCTTESVGIYVEVCKDLAFHPNGKLYATSGEKLFFVDLPNSCDHLIGNHELPPDQYINALVSDTEGNLYGAALKNDKSKGFLYEINTTTGSANLIGELPFIPKGDLFFYKGGLFLTGFIADATPINIRIIKVDIEDPSNSYIFGTTPFSTLGAYGEGVATFLDSCNNERIFINTYSDDIYELDINDFNVNLICDIPGAIGGMAIPNEFLASECFNCDNMSVSSNTISPGCYGGSNGSIEVIVEGAEEPFTYLWNDPNSQDTKIATGLPAGTYTVLVTDANGCSLETDITLLDTPDIEISTNIIQVSCHNGNDAMVHATASGGNGGYNYTWSNGQQGSLLSNVGAGIYSLTVIDIFECIATEFVTITQPDLIFSNISSSSDNGSCNGTATTIVSGGVMPYSYLWEPGEQTTNNASNLCNGNYTVTITDANGCTTVDSVEVTLVTEVVEPEALIYSISPNPTMGRLFIQLDDLSSPNSTIKIFNSEGGLVMTKRTSGNMLELNIASLSHGIYFLSIENGSNIITQKIIKNGL